MKKLFITALVLTAVSVSVSADGINYPPETPTVTFEQSNLPLVFINTGNTQIDREQRITATMTIISNANGVNYTDTIAHPGQRIDYKGYIGIRYRGSSSFDQPKKPYSIHTLETPYEKGGKKQKVSLLGMPADNKWALLASHSDKSLMRDLLALRLGRNYLPYAPDGRFCEMFLDGIYYGVFILSEMNSQGKSRLNLTKPGTSGDALTGGYYIKVDRSSDPHFWSNHHPRTSDYAEIINRSTCFVFDWPDYEDLTEVQVNYIQGAVRAMEDVLASDNFADPTEGYAKVIDVTSFIDCMLTTEFSHNVDGYRLSTGIFKRCDKTDPRFHATIWDYNIAFGNAEYYEAYRTDTWIYLNNDIMIENGDQNLIPFWWQRLMQDSAYVAQLKLRWQQYRSEAYSNEHLMTMIDSMATALSSGGAIERNNEAWNVWNRYFWPNFYVAPDFASEVNYLKEWITARLKFMDRELIGVDEELPIGDINGDLKVDIADLNILVNLITGSDPSGDYAGKADLDGDDKIDVNDINALINSLLNE